MKLFFVVIFILIILGVAGGVWYFFNTKEADLEPAMDVREDKNDTDNIGIKIVNFSEINPEFLFSAELPSNLQVEYVPNLRALNIYNPFADASNNLEKSQIYISFFRANSFLTLGTVNITRREDVTINGRPAVLYEIEKRPGAIGFLGQPSWRPKKHIAIDVRYSENNPTYFYSFAKEPNYPETIFNQFIDSINFQ